VLRENSEGGIQLMGDETSFELPPFEEADHSEAETEADGETDSEKTGDEDGDEDGD